MGEQTYHNHSKSNKNKSSERLRPIHVLIIGISPTMALCKMMEYMATIKHILDNLVW